MLGRATSVPKSMTPKLRTPVFLAFLVLAAEAAFVFAGDSLYGKLVDVSKSGEVVTLAYGACSKCTPGQYQIRIAGISVPPFRATGARSRILALIPLKEFARMRLVRREGNEMVAQLLTGDVRAGIKDVGIELLRNNLAVMLKTGSDKFYGYKYGELTAAELEGKNLARFGTPTPTPVPPTPVVPTPTPTPVLIP